MQLAPSSTSDSSAIAKSNAVDTSSSREAEDDSHEELEGILLPATSVQLLRKPSTTFHYYVD